MFATEMFDIKLLDSWTKMFEIWTYFFKISFDINDPSLVKKLDVDQNVKSFVHNIYEFNQ